MSLYINNIQEDIQTRLAEIKTAYGLIILDANADAKLFEELFHHCPTLKNLMIKHDTLTTLPNLKKLDLRFMHDYSQGNLIPMTIPVDMEKKLPNCKILV